MKLQLLYTVDRKSGRAYARGALPRQILCAIEARDAAVKIAQVELRAVRTSARDVVHSVRTRHFSISFRLPTSQTEEIYERHPEAPDNLPFRLDIWLRRQWKVLSIEWDDYGGVSVQYFRRGEWEPELARLAHELMPDRSSV